jgi:NADPH:quinone reductase-like Zn-dependent oxidoreductase
LTGRLPPPTRRAPELTGGEGAHVVHDNGGTATFRSSQLGALRRDGVHAFYGNLMGNPACRTTGKLLLLP